MVNNAGRFHPKLADIRAEAWQMLPFWRQLAARLVWYRKKCNPGWNITPFEPDASGARPFEIIGGMFIYSVSEEIAAYAPRDAVLAIYGCLLVHTNRFWYRPGDVIHANGNGDVHLLSSWPESVRIASHYGFAVDLLHRWMEPGAIGDSI